jgi:hypothetical protein
VVKVNVFVQEIYMRISQWSKVDTKWYLGVLCGKCQTPILFALDHSEGEVQPVPPAKLLLTCTLPECKYQADYSDAAVSRFQKLSSSLNTSGKGQ